MAISRAIPVDSIAEQAANVRPGRTAITVLLSVFFAIGWIAGRSWVVIVWASLTVREGYRAGSKPKNVPSQL